MTRGLLILVGVTLAVTIGVAYVAQPRRWLTLRWG